MDSRNYPVFTVRRDKVIQFEHGKRARVILCLAAEDQTKHIGIIRDIRTALSKAAYIDELTRAADAQEVCEILRARLEKT